MENIKGKITKVTKFEGIDGKQSRYSYKLDDNNYYSGFGDPELKENQIVSIDYKLNEGNDGKQYRNIAKVSLETTGLDTYNKMTTNTVQSVPIQRLYDPENVVKDKKLKVVDIHKWAYEEVCKIIGREPIGDEMTLVNSMVVNYFKSV